MSCTAEPSAPSSKKAKPNPYSTRGLDKFSTVLAELGARKEKIIAKAGSQGIAMVRFVYDNSKDWIPIIVRPKRAAEDKKPSPQPAPAKELEAATEETKVPKRSSGWKGSYYWALVVVAVLSCLVTFGRVFAICCTCLLWYTRPTFRDCNRKNGNRSIKKKE